MKKIIFIVILLLCLLPNSRCICDEIHLIEDVCVLQQNESRIVRSVSRIIDPDLGVVCYEYDWGSSNGVSMSCIPFSFLDMKAQKQIRDIIKKRKEDKNKIMEQ